MGEFEFSCQQQYVPYIAFVHVRRSLVKRHSGTPARELNLHTGVGTACVQLHYEIGLYIIGFYAGMVADQVGAGFRVKVFVWNAADE